MIHQLKQYDSFTFHPSDDIDYIDSMDIGKVELDDHIFWIKIYGGESIVPHFHLVCPELNEEYCFELYNARYYNHGNTTYSRLSNENLYKLNQALHELNYAAAEHNGSSKLNVWEECNRWYFDLQDHWKNSNPSDMRIDNPVQPDYTKIEN